MKKLIKNFLHCTNHLIERVGGIETSCIFKWEKNKDKDDTSSSQIPLFFENTILEYYVRAIPASKTLTQSTIVAVDFSFFLSFARVTWEKIVKNNFGCVIALTQSTIVAVSYSYSEQLWLWASLFSFYSQGHVVKGSEKKKKKKMNNSYMWKGKNN